MKLEKLIDENKLEELYELNMEIEKLKRKLRIKESALKFIKNEIERELAKQLYKDDDEDNCVHNRKAFHDI